MTLLRLATISCLAMLLTWGWTSDAARRRHRRRHGAAPAAAAARGKHKVAVLSFSGPSAAAARNGIVRALKARQVSPKAFEQTAAQLGVNAESPAGIAAVCAKLGCDAVVKGLVQKRGRKFTLTVTVYDGGTGQPLGRRQATARAARRLTAAGAAIGAQSQGLVAQGKSGGTAAVAGQPPQPQPQPKAEPVARAEPPKAEQEKVPEYKPEPEQPVKTAKAAKATREKGSEEGGEGEGGDEEGVRKRPSRGERGERNYAGLFDASFAIGFAMRNVVVDQDPKYEGGLYPEFTLRAAFYPLVLATRNFARNLGLGVSYSRHLSISTKDKAGNPVSSTSQEFMIDLRLRWVILNSDSSPEITFLAGFGMRDFNLGKNDTLPSFNPKFIRFGFEGGVPFGTQYIGLGVGFDARVLLSAGEVVQYYGNRSGGFGFAVRGGLQGKVALGITYFAGVEFLRFAANFGGLTAAGVVPDPPDLRDHKDPTSLTDRYIRIWAGAGYAY